jgi:hypothetical protein
MSPRTGRYGTAATAVDAPTTPPRTLADAMGPINLRLCPTVSAVPTRTQNCGNTADEMSPTVA